MLVSLMGVVEKAVGSIHQSGYLQHLAITTISTTGSEETSKPAKKPIGNSTKLCCLMLQKHLGGKDPGIT